MLAVKPVRDFQREVPMVLGIISENTRISMVVNALTSPNHWEPNRIVACLPTPAAPMVFEIVLSERMAANALEGSCLYRLSLVAALRPSSSLKVMYEIGVLMRAASNMEQRKEVHRAQRRNIINSVILLFTTKILDISYTGDVLLVFAEMYALCYERNSGCLDKIPELACKNGYLVGISGKGRIKCAIGDIDQRIAHTQSDICDIGIQQRSTILTTRNIRVFCARSPEQKLMRSRQLSL